MTSSVSVAIPATQSAPQPTWTDVYGVGINSGLLVIGAISAYFVLEQLKKLTDANKNANLMLVIQVEINITNGRNKVIEAAMEKVKAANAIPFDQQAADTAKYLHRSAVEEYLNALDRLCAFIRRGHIDEDVYREDYRQTLVDDIKEYAWMFGPDTRHHNILKVHEAWQDGKDAHVKKTTS